MDAKRGVVLGELGVDGDGTLLNDGCLQHLDPVVGIGKGFGCAVAFTHQGHPAGSIRGERVEAAPGSSSKLLGRRAE